MYEYDLAKRIKGSRPSRGIELATVEKAEPLTLSIGGVSYSSKDWAIYAPSDLWLEGVMMSGDGSIVSPSVSCAAEGASVSNIRFTGLMVDRLVGAPLLMEGDLVAVYELGGQSFVILSKVERVM